MHNKLLLFLSNPSPLCELNSAARVTCLCVVKPSMEGKVSKPESATERVLKRWAAERSVVIAICLLFLEI